ncbi:TPA: phage tail protein, partial [Haemophilus influenzae]
FPDLYRTLGNHNQLPDLTRSDVGMTAYFAVDNIPAGWIAFDEIATQVTEQRYPELYRHLVGKYGSIERVPKVADRFLRNAGNGLSVGQTQEDELKRHVHKHIENNTATNPRFYNDKTFDYGSRDSTDRASLDIATAVVDDNNDNWWITPNINSNFATGGAETRPKSLILKLCIKALNSFDDVVFWIKSHGEVTNAGALDAGRLAQGLQDKAA